MEAEIIRVRAHGGPEVLVSESLTFLPPGPGEALVRHTAIGVNFVDIYHRSAQFGHDSPPLPFTPGFQAVGIVEAVGEGVACVAPGQRVAWVGGTGGYATARLIEAARLVVVPDDIEDTDLAAVFVRGLTAEYLLRRLVRVRFGNTVLLHAAAGGLGQIIARWAHSLGVNVIGTVRGESRASIARAQGCTHVIDVERHDFVARVDDLTDGGGVDIVYDSVGKDTFLASLACLKPRGWAINFGTASGQVEGFSLQALHRKSLVVCRPTLESYISDPGELRAAAEEVFAAMRTGVIALTRIETLPLAQAREAHRRLQGRGVEGALVLLP